jgi:flagellar basal-body rod protein FlgB
MPEKLSLSKTFNALENAINIAYQRHNLISSNISNLDTSNKKAMDIDFKTAMAKALESKDNTHLTKTNAGHMGADPGDMQQAEPFEEKGEWNGYNWINIDREMRKLIENNLQYRTATEILLRKISTMKEVIRGGR